MHRRTIPYSIVAVLCSVQFVLGLVFSPYSCGWGLPVFMATGAVMMLLLLSMPFFNRRAFSRHSRLSYGLMFSGIGLATWLLSMFIAFPRSGCG